jgi:hypothetical protein
MATVRFSDELRQRIKHKASQMFDERIKAARDNPPNWAGNIYDLAFGENVAKMNDFPAGYFATDNDINLRGFKGKGWDENINENICMYFNEATDEYRKFPHDISSVNNESMGLCSAGYGWTFNADDPRWDSIKKEYKKYCLKIHKLEKEQDVFIAGVSEVINAYSTLAPALKAWPALWDLVPEDKKDKHREVATRTKASDTAKNLAEEVDLSKLTGHVTADKLTR